MTEFRKYAFFQLVVAGMSALAVVVLFAWSGNVTASLAGFSLLAISGVRALMARGSVAQTIQDERDEAIQRQATLIAYTALWLALVAWGVTVPLMFGESGTVPLGWVAPVVWVGAWIVITVQAAAILMLDSRGA